MKYLINDSIDMDAENDRIEHENRKTRQKIQIKKKEKSQHFSQPIPSAPDLAARSEDDEIDELYREEENRGSVETF